MPTGYFLIVVVVEEVVRVSGWVLAQNPALAEFVASEAWVLIVLAHEVRERTDVVAIEI